MSEAYAALESDRIAQSRSSTAEWAADRVRDRITDGSFKPGERLPEDRVGSSLGVSRNTLREAFRLLVHERLVVAEFNRGVFVRRLGPADIVDLYRVRRLVECAAVRQVGEAPPEAVAALRQVVADAERAADEGRWRDVGTANMRFHQALVALAGSPRLDEYLRQVSAELRLAFHVMTDPHAFHEPYRLRNREIAELLEAGDGEGAEKRLIDYLDDAERELLDATAES